MNKENMAEQPENKDWLDKLGEFFSKIFINPDKDIAYSIRKRGNDENKLLQLYIVATLYTFFDILHKE